MKAIGIVGVVVGLLIRLALQEPSRQHAIVHIDSDDSGEVSPQPRLSNLRFAKTQLRTSFSHILRMRSLWLLTLSSGARQFSGNVFGYYMPTYISSTYPTQSDILSKYGIIVGVVGSVAVVAGGLISSYTTNRMVEMPLYITGIGGMISSIFVILMVLSLNAAGGDPTRGTNILYGTMSAAYLTAELWLGAYASLLALLLPPQTKTFGFAIYSSIVVLVYSSGPQIIGLALRNYDIESAAYLEKTKVILAVLIPAGYWVAGIGLLLAVSSVRRDVAGDIVPIGYMSKTRKMAFGGFAAVLGGLVVALFVTSLVYR